MRMVVDALRTAADYTLGTVIVLTRLILAGGEARNDVRRDAF